MYKNLILFSRLRAFKVTSLLVSILVLTTYHGVLATKSADLNNDGVVNALDLSIMLSNWGSSTGLGDLNSDGIVNVLDLSLLLSSWQTATPTPTPTPTVSVDTENPFASMQLYDDPTNAKVSQQTIAGYTNSIPSDYDLGNNTSPYPSAAVAQAALRDVNAIPQPRWLSGEPGDAQTLATTIGGAKAQGKLAFFLLYNIPDRDNNGGINQGGAANLAAYKAWINSLVAAIHEGDDGTVYPSACIIEPDALNLLKNLTPTQVTERYASIAYAAQALAAADVSCYIDAGSTMFAGTSGTTQAQSLYQAGIQYARGFSTNVANFGSTSAEVTFGNNIIAALKAKGVSSNHLHQVIDTSRNGSGIWNGSPSPQYNPPGRSAGSLPTANVQGVSGASSAHQDAFLWIKTVLYTDYAGLRCPAAGGAFPDYLVDMVPRSSWFTSFNPSQLNTTASQ